MNELQKLMSDIAEWSDATFGEGQRNPAIVYHLHKEVKELIEAIEEFQNDKTNDNLDEAMNEFADCFILLLDAAHHFGLRASMIHLICTDKLAINKKRKWGESDENGVVEHIK